MANSLTRRVDKLEDKSPADRKIETVIDRNNEGRDVLIEQRCQEIGYSKEDLETIDWIVISFVKPEYADDAN